CRRGPGTDQVGDGRADHDAVERDQEVGRVAAHGQRHVERQRQEGQEREVLRPAADQVGDDRDAQEARHRPGRGQRAMRDDLCHGFSPEYGADFAPTPHPGWTGIASLALPFGSHADSAMAWVVLLSFGALVYLVYRLGETLFTRWAGVVAALIVLTRAAMQR